MAISQISKELVTNDFVVVDDFSCEKDCSRLRDFIVTRRREGKMLSGTEWLSKVRRKGKSVKKDYVERLRKTTRSDLVFWCNGDRKGEECVSDYAERLSTLLDKLKVEVTELRQVESRSEAMLTCYPPGGSRYSIHVDNPDPAKSERKLTAILYLNPSWNASHGGELEIYDADTQQEPRTRIEPHEGRLLLFWSDKRVPHAVLPSYSNRYAVTIWLYAMPPKKKSPKQQYNLKNRMIRAREEVVKLRKEVDYLVSNSLNGKSDSLIVNEKKKCDPRKETSTKKACESKKETNRQKLSSSAIRAIRDIAKAYQNETSKHDQDEALLQLAYDLPDNIGELPVAEALRVLIADDDEDETSKITEEKIESFNWGDSEKFVKIYIPMCLEEDDTVSVKQEKRKLRVEFRIAKREGKGTIKILELSSLPGDLKKVTWKRKFTKAKGNEVVVVLWKQIRGQKWDI